MSHIDSYEHCLELGAGPGRVTEGLLAFHFDKIDLNDIVNFRPQWSHLQKQLQTQKKRHRSKGLIDEVFNCCMSKVDYSVKKYNVIYSNWGFNYLNDPDVLTLLSQAKYTLATWDKKPGVIIAKENIVEEG